MNFQNLEYFLAAAREQNITHAAEKLNISQQALSGQILRIEEELGCRLFDRKRGFHLTAEGKELLKSSRQILEIYDRTGKIIRDISDNKRGELRIGITHTRGQAILPLLLPEFVRMHPLVTLSITEGSTRVLEESLERGDIDVLIGFKPFRFADARTIDLVKENLYIVAPKTLLTDQFGTDYQEVLQQYRACPDLAIFRDLPFIMMLQNDRGRNIVDSEFRRAELAPRIRLETQNMQTAYVLACEGLGLTVVPEIYLYSRYTVCGQEYTALREKAEVLPFTSPGSTVVIGCHSGRYLSTFARDFMDLAICSFRDAPDDSADQGHYTQNIG